MEILPGSRTQEKAITSPTDANLSAEIARPAQWIALQDSLTLRPSHARPRSSCCRRNAARANRASARACKAASKLQTLASTLAH